MNAGDSKGEVMKKVLEAWVKGYRSPKLIAEHYGLNYNAVRTAIYRLKKKGLIKPDPSLKALEIRFHNMESYVSELMTKLAGGSKVSLKDLDKLLDLVREGRRIVTYLEAHYSGVNL